MSAEQLSVAELRQKVERRTRHLDRYASLMKLGMLLCSAVFVLGGIIGDLSVAVPCGFAAIVVGVALIQHNMFKVLLRLTEERQEEAK